MLLAWALLNSAMSLAALAINHDNTTHVDQFSVQLAEQVHCNDMDLEARTEWMRELVVWLNGVVDRLDLDPPTDEMPLPPKREKQKVCPKTGKPL